MEAVRKIVTNHRAPRRLVCPSTLAFIKEAQASPKMSLLDLIHGYVYGRWPYLYIGLGIGEHWLVKLLRPFLGLLGRLRPNPPSLSVDQVTMADGYHGKVLPLESACQLVAVNEPVYLTNLEQIIPYKLARDIILKNPDHIVALDCPCRSARANPCMPLDVCLIVGEPFASFVIEHHPQKSRWISPQEAQTILQEEHERGHVHHAYFKDAMLGRFYAICNCCSCCCGAMQAVRRGNPMIANSGYVSEIDEVNCIGCGTCVQACPFEAMSIELDIAAVDRDRCMGCGVCVSACDLGAITLVRDPTRGEPLEVNALLEAQAKRQEIQIVEKFG
jgi:ferredoxin